MASESISSSGIEAFLNSQEFERAWLTCFKEPLLFRDFQSLTPPAGCSQETFWNALTTVKKCSGTTFLGTSPMAFGNYYAWFYQPESMRRDLLAIINMAESAQSGESPSQAAGHSYDLAPFAVKEIAARARYDGLQIPDAAIEDMWLGRRQARTPEETVIANMAALFRESRTWAQRRLSHAVLFDLYDALVDGIEPELMNLMPRNHWKYDDDLSIDASMIDTILTITDRICAHSRETSPVVHPIISSITLEVSFWDRPILPHFNSLCEFLFHRIFLVQQGFHLLSYAPLVALSEEGETGYVTTFDAERRFLTNTLGVSMGFDTTVLIAGALRVYREAISDIARHLKSLEETNRHREAWVNEIPDLNKRQREALALAGRNPDMRFTLKGYVAANDVVYSTAREDLMNLVDRGLFICEKEGRAFVFRPTSTFLEQWQNAPAPKVPQRRSGARR